MYTRALLLFATAITVTACAESRLPTPTDPISAAIAGRTLLADPSAFTIGADGSLTGSVGVTNFIGTWEVRDGQYCRTYTFAPSDFLGTKCLPTELGDGTITLVDLNGPVTYEIRQ